MFGLTALSRLRHAPLDFYLLLQKQQGDCATIRLGPYRLRLLLHPREISEVLTTRSADFVRFERVMKILSQWNGQSLLILEGQDWHARRRRILPAFARRRMNDYARCSVTGTTQLISEWKLRIKNGTIVVDTDYEMARLALNIALDAMFGKQADPNRDDIAKAVGVFSYVAYSETAGFFRTPSWWPFGIGLQKTRAIKTVDRLVHEMIRDCKSGNNIDRGDLLSILMEGDAREARDDAVTLLIAGHETTGAALSWLAYLLSTAPKALAAAQAEIDKLQGRTATNDDFNQLPFIRATVAETLRLYPPAYGLFPRRAIVDTHVGSVAIRRNEIVLLSPFVTQRDPRWFEDPQTFRPERFLAEPAWPEFAYFPFGAGPRVCIGQQFGLVEITLAAATLLQHFTPTVVDTPVQAEAKFSLRPKGGMQQRWVLRSVA